MPDVRFFDELKSIFVLPLMILGLSISSSASVGEVREVPFQIGVVTQFWTNSEDVIPTLNTLADVGVNSIRDGIYWHKVETVKGLYSVPLRMDLVVNTALERNISPLIVLSGRAPSFHGGGRPFSAEKQEAYIRFAEHVVQRYKGSGIHYEIGNEWNIHNGKNLSKKARQAFLLSYVGLLEKLSPRLRAIDNSLKIVGPVMTGYGVDRGELEFMLSKGLLDYVDIISIHRYPAKGPVTDHRTSPESLIDWLVKVENTLMQYSGNTPVPIFLSEVSWPTANSSLRKSKRHYTVTEAAQRDYLTRTYLLARRYEFIKGIWWFNLIDKNALNGERYYGAKDAPSFGLMVRDTEENKTIFKSSFFAFNYISEIIKDGRINSKIKNDCPSVQSMNFITESQQILVMWSPESRPTIKLNMDPSSSDQYQVIVQRAGDARFSPKGKAFDLELNANPVAIYFPTFVNMPSVSMASGAPCIIASVNTQ
jgi:polysaccharide biosynthesis protein PslG